MGHGVSTCWDLIEGAADGDRARRALFVARYGPLVREYFAARWRGTAWLADVADAESEVFLECLRSGGVLEKADRAQPSGFRAFLYGVLRNVARRHEESRLGDRHRQQASEFHREGGMAPETRVSRVLDRAWARGILAAAAERHRAAAAEDGDAGLRRVEVLRLRFEVDLPIREIAKRWGMDPEVVHREYRRARREFRRHLEAELAFHGELGEDPERQWEELIALLQG